MVTVSVSMETVIWFSAFFAVLSLVQVAAAIISIVSACGQQTCLESQRAAQEKVSRQDKN